MNYCLLLLFFINFSEFETLTTFTSRYENVKVSPQESGSKVISGGHAHAIVYRRRPSANWIDRESKNCEKLASLLIRCMYKKYSV